MKNLIPFVAFWFCSLSISAQIDKLPNLISGNQLLIQQTVESGFIVIKQTYQLCDTTQNPPQYYGRNNENFFGLCYSFAVKTDSGFFCLDNVINPWDYDPDFDEYKNSTQYKPVIYKTYYREIDNPQFVEFSSSLDSYRTILSNEVYSFDTDEFTDGFELDTVSFDNEGWLVWVSLSDNKTFEDSAAFSFVIYRSTLKFNENENQYSVNLPSGKKVTDGCFFQPSFVGVGKLHFSLAGMAKANADSGFVIPLALKTTVTPNDHENILTPVDSNSQNAPNLEETDTKKNKSGKN